MNIKTAESRCRDHVSVGPIIKWCCDTLITFFTIPTVQSRINRNTVRAVVCLVNTD
jgi:hypothetical protein